MNTRFVVLFLLTMTLVLSSFSQETKKNVIYLKNGRIITGTIIEIIPDQLVKILTAENISYTIAFTDISYIGNERLEYYSEITDTTIYALGIKFSLYAGIALPVDEFGNISHRNAGYAKTGSIFGAEVNFPLIRSFYINATVAVINNSVDVESFRLNGLPSTVTSQIGTWNTYWFMPGLHSEAKVENVTLFAGINYGWAKVNSPVISLSQNYSNVSSLSYSNTQSGYSVSIGATVFEFISFGVRYYNTNPMLPVTVMSNPELLHPSSGSPNLPTTVFYRQPVSLFTFIAGVSF